MVQKVIIKFWWECGLSSTSKIHLTTFCRPFVHYTCLFKIVPRWFTLSETIAFILSTKADQRKRWPHWLHYQVL